MSVAVDNMFCVFRVISASKNPMTVDQIAKKTWLSEETVRRHSRRLAKEGLIDITQKDSSRNFEYIKKGLEK